MLRRTAPFLFATLVASAARADELVPVADFFRYPMFSSAVMSPAGRFVAVTVKGGQRGRAGLVVLDLRDLSKSKALAGYVDADVTNVRWVNEDRLIYGVMDTQSTWADQRTGGLFVADREGKEPARKLNAGRFHSLLRDGSNDILVLGGEHNQRGYTGTTLYRLDTFTGKARPVSFGGPDNVWHWAVDREGEPRVAVTAFEGKSRLYWKQTATSPWTQVWEHATYGTRRDDFTPVAVDSANVLYVTGYHEKEDTRSLSRVDMSQKATDTKPLMSLKGYDFSGQLVFGAGGGVIGVRYLTDARGTHWFDARLKDIQSKVDALSPGLINEIDCGLCKDPSTVLVRSWSDRQPTVFRLYEISSGTMKMLGQARPWIKPQAMARREMQRITARDGLSIPVHITRPNGEPGPKPTVVLVHGGPYLRGGEWRWEADSQFLASRGYVVIEPEFRGSTGFGHSLFAAGWKQWGLAMQDDIADATQWAVKQGYADPKRICIAGGSYGGYATLMGLIRYPDLYRCGINYVGVTDLNLMYSSRWSDFSEMWKEYGMPVLVGEENSPQLKDTSPINLAAKLTQPLLMAYGGEDWRVPIQHGVYMRDAVAPHNKNLEWITYPDEGHGWVLESNRVDFWTRVEKFLDKHLKRAPS